MACSVVKNKQGKIIKVLDPNTGKESKVFNEIAQLPHVESLEQAVDIYDEVLKANSNSGIEALKKTEEFKEWFGDSKIVDEDGNPLLVYHGGEKGIENFKIKGDPTYKNNDPHTQNGIYFTKSIKIAGTYTLRADNPAIYQVYLSIQNPYDITKLENYNKSGVALITDNDIVKMKEGGYDGIIEGGYDGDIGGEIIVLDPKQVKIIPKSETSGPTINIVSGGVLYPSFKEALDNTDSKTIDIVSNDTIIMTMPSTVDENTLPGAINSFIKDNILEDKKIIIDGKTYFRPVGESFYNKTVAEEFFKEVVGETLDTEQYTVRDGLIEIRPKTEEVSSEGSLHRIIADKMLEYFSADTVISKKSKIDENNLKLNLMKILSDMGVSVMSLKQYQDKFKQKSKNIPPSAEALADIANRVIAFKDGKLTLDNLTEEVMHLIVETLPQEQLQELSQFIKDSQEYQDYYNQYKEIYKNDDTLIEKEILGKILKNITLNKLQGKNQSFVSRLVNIIKNFFENLTLNQNQRNQLKQLNGLVERFVIEKDGDSFSEDDLSQSREIALMYSLSDQVSNTQGGFLKTFKNITDFKQFNSYKRELKNTSFDKLSGSELSSAVSRFIEMSTKLIETTESAIKTAKNKRKSLSGQNRAILEDLHGEIASHLDSLAVELDTPQPGIQSKERNKLSEKLRENSARISELRALNDQTTDDHINQMVDEIAQQMGQAESEFLRSQVEKVLRGEIKDTNKMFSFFGQLHHASNPVLNMIGSKIWEMNMKANQGIKEDMSPFLNYIDENPHLKTT